MIGDNIYNEALENHLIESLIEIRENGNLSNFIDDIDSWSLVILYEHMKSKGLILFDAIKDRYVLTNLGEMHLIEFQK